MPAARRHWQCRPHLLLEHVANTVALKVPVLIRSKYHAHLANMLQLATELLPDEVVDGGLDVQEVDVDTAGLPDAVRPVLRLDQVPRRPGVLRKHHHRRALQTSLLPEFTAALSLGLQDLGLLESAMCFLALLACLMRCTRSSAWTRSPGVQVYSANATTDAPCAQRRLQWCLMD